MQFQQETLMRIFLLGAVPSITPPRGADVQKKLELTGGNTGNAVIAHGLLKQLVYTSISWDHSIPPEQVGEEFDMIVIAAANFIYPKFDFGGMASYIERTGLPVFIVGLGAQSSSYSPVIELMPGTERFLKVVAERAPLIGVRGPFTAEVLAHKGIRNVQVTGCPSYYAEARPPLAWERPRWREGMRITVNASRDVPQHSFDPARMRHVVSGIMSEAVRLGGDFIAQTEMTEIRLAEGAGGDEVAPLLEQMTKLFPEIDAAALTEWSRSHLKVYYDVEAWSDHMSEYDFVFGTRFHGNMIGLQRGVPCFVIAHDTRTEDMCRFLGLPYASIHEFDEISAERLFERVDPVAVNRRYEQLMPAYAGFLDQNHVPNRFRRAAASAPLPGVHNAA
jgi:polysaccharide pyruvyl transferase WcaK-like protein